MYGPGFRCGAGAASAKIGTTSAIARTSRVMDMHGIIRHVLAVAIDLRDGVDHQLEFGEQRVPGRLRQRVKIVEQPPRRQLLLVQLPRRDLPLDRAAEEVRRGEAIHGEEPFELWELERVAL